MKQQSSVSDLTPPDSQIVTHVGDLDELYGAWAGDSLSGVTPTQSLPWTKACANRFAADVRLSVVNMRKGNRPVAIAPLYREHGLFKSFAQLGVRQLLEPTDFIYEDVEALQLLTDELAAQKMPLSLYRLPGDSRVPNALRDSYRAKALILSRAGNPYPFIELTGGDVEQHLSSRLRQDLRRARRKAENMGKVSFALHAPSNKDDFLPLFNELLRVEAASWKGSAGSALSLDAARKRFYQEYGIAACENGSLRMGFMYIDDVAVAAQLAVESEGRYWLFKIGFDEKYAKCSPGLLLTLETLRYASDTGLVSYEFLGTAAHWTKRWTKTERGSLMVAVYPYTLSGLFAFIGDASRYLWWKTIKSARKSGN